MKKTPWSGTECPLAYTVRRNAGLLQLTIYVDVMHEAGEEGQSDIWTAVEITMPVGVADYSSIVSAIIDSHYSNDQMQAIVNNHLIGEHEEEFEEMQQYRLYAKQTAKDIVEDLEKGKEVGNG